MVYSLVSIYFSSPQLCIQQKQTIQNFRELIQNMLNFYFLEKGREIISRTHFLYDFSGKMFLVLYSLN